MRQTERKNLNRFYHLLKADHLYVRALAFSEADTEEHKRALQNRQRTQVYLHLDRV